jgi:hypothetical protein
MDVPDCTVVFSVRHLQRFDTTPRSRRDLLPLLWVHHGPVRSLALEGHIAEFSHLEPEHVAWGCPLLDLQRRCAGLSSCEFAARRLVQVCEPATGIIVIDIPAAFDCPDAIDNPSGQIEFK